jgi:hypothetical protein
MPFFLFYCVAIRCNNELLRLIAPCQKETTTHAKHHPTEGFRLNVPKAGLVVKTVTIKNFGDCACLQDGYNGSHDSTQCGQCSMSISNTRFNNAIVCASDRFNPVCLIKKVEMALLNLIPARADADGQRTGNAMEL